MAAITRKFRIDSLKRIYMNKKHYRLQKILFSTNEHESEKKESEKEFSGFAKFFKQQNEAIEPPAQDSFATLLRNSKFIDLGDPKGKCVIGTIYHVKGDDLYIDFGWKFPTVCSKPTKNKELYILGAKVKLLIKELELSTRFLGGTTDLTLCEADCVLLGLAK